MKQNWCPHPTPGQSGPVLTFSLDSCVPSPAVSLPDSYFSQVVNQSNLLNTILNYTAIIPELWHLLQGVNMDFASETNFANDSKRALTKSSELNCTPCGQPPGKRKRNPDNYYTQSVTVIINIIIIIIMTITINTRNTTPAKPREGRFGYT